MDREDLVATYEVMATMRRFEEEVGAGVASGEIHGEMHLGIGQEAVSAVLARHLRDGDAIVSTHRPHLHALALGVDPVGLLAEIFERDGLNHGKGGHMHLFDPVRRFMCTGIVGASAPLAAGYALAQKHRREAGITVAVTGDGAMNQGAVFETMNLAAVLPLPVLFLCEDNAYSISVPRAASTAGELHRRGEAMGIHGEYCDGRDVEALDEAFRDAVAYVREERRPRLLVAEVYRFRGHYEGDPDLYRTEAEKQEAMSERRDPLPKLRQELRDLGIPEEDLRALEERAAATVEEWLAAARERPFPRIETAAEGVYAHG